MDFGHFWYALGWASFGLGHSLLAAQTVRARLGAGRSYRLVYNAIAALHLGALIWLGRTLLSTSPFEWPAAVGLAGDGVILAGLAVIVIAVTRYDCGRFLGLAQLREPPDGAGNARAAAEPLRTDGPHRYVRHPLYSGLFLMLWGNARDEFGLATAVWGSLYLAVGTRFEERRLAGLYGSAYADYRRAVPAFVPAIRPGRRRVGPD